MLCALCLVLLLFVVAGASAVALCCCFVLLLLWYKVECAAAGMVRQMVSLQSASPPHHYTAQNSLQSPPQHYSAQRSLGESNPASAIQDFTSPLSPLHGALNALSAIERNPFGLHSTGLHSTGLHSTGLPERSYQSPAQGMPPSHLLCMHILCITENIGHRTCTQRGGSVDVPDLCCGACELC